LEGLGADGKKIMDIEEVIWGGIDWINLAKSRYG
jgi:hypothetical protein